MRQLIFKPLGAFKHMLAQTSLWISAVNFILIGVTAYNTTLREHILTVVPDFKLWHFMLVLIGILLVMMLIEYKLVYPSWIAFQNQQEYKHENLLRKDIAKLRKEIAELKGVSGEDSTGTPQSAAVRRRGKGHSQAGESLS